MTQHMEAFSSLVTQNTSKTVNLFDTNPQSVMNRGSFQCLCTKIKVFKQQVKPEGIKTNSYDKNPT